MGGSFFLMKYKITYCDDINNQLAEKIAFATYIFFTKSPNDILKFKKSVDNMAEFEYNISEPVRFRVATR